MNVCEIRDLVIVDESVAVAEGRKRQAAHSENGTERFFSDKSHEDILGITAELAFEMWSGIKADTTIRPRGDGGIDFSFSIGERTMSIDVKAARKPIYLLLKENAKDKAAGIMVLALVASGAVLFVGWEHKSLMLLSPKRDFGYGIINHYRHSSELRPMWQLHKLIYANKTK